MTAPPNKRHDSARDSGHREKPHDPTAFLLGLILLAFLVHELQWVLLPFVVAGLVAYLLTPVIEGMTARLRKPRWVTVALVFLGILGLVGLVIWFGIWPLLRDLARTITDINSLIENLARALVKDRRVDLFGRTMNAGQLAQAAVSGAQQWLDHPARVALIGAGVVATGFGIVVTFVLLFYFLLNGPKLVKGALWIAPAEYRWLLIDTARGLDPLLRRYFIGVIIIVTYAAFAAYLGLDLALHIKRAVILAVITGVLEIIPVVGPAISATLAGLVAIRSAVGIGPIIGYAIYVLALRLSIDQLVGPIALGAAARLNPAIIIFCFFAGGVLFGVVGIILAVPTALTVKVTLAVLRGEADAPISERKK